MDLYVTCPQGLEILLATELGSLGFTDTTTSYCGVYVNRVNFDAIYRINYSSRLASRVLLPIKKFRCRDAKSLYNDLKTIDWTLYFKRGKTFAIDANVSHPNIRNSLYAAQVAKDAICDQIREKEEWRPSVNVKDPAIQLNLFVSQGSAVISYDTSGQPLHKRGYRLETVEAPLQETLAAAMLKMAEYQGTEVFCDPCCGSGTIVIEAAMVASKTPPGFFRQQWGFMGHPDYSPEVWKEIKLAADAAIIPLQKNMFFCADVNKQAVHATKVNLRSTGFLPYIEIELSDIQAYHPRELPNFVMVNPPYGKRLDENVSHLKSLYRELGDFMKRETKKPARGFLLTSSQELSKEIGLAAKRRHVLNNGGLDSRLLEYDLY